MKKSNITVNKFTALYVRVSTDAQYEEGYSVEAQQKKLKQWCKLHDVKNFEFYIDGGWSGSNINRPDIQRLIKDINLGKIEKVVVYKLDRLSRSQKDTIFLLEDVFEPCNVSFVSISENFDTTTPYGKAMVGILSVFAQLERENIRERTRMGMYERVKEGKWMGGGTNPFGYDYDAKTNMLVPNEHAEEVKQIYKLYLQGYSTTQLAKMFPVSGDRQISQILRRETYLGKINYKGEIFQGKHEALIDDDTWKEAQIQLEKRSTKKYTQSHYLFTGLIYCGKCGAKMRYQKWGKGLKIWCYSQDKNKPNLIKNPHCNNMRIDAREFEELVLNDLFEMTDKYISVVNEKTIKFNNYKKEITAIGVLENRKDELIKKIKNLYNLYAASEDEILLETIKENQKELNTVSQMLESEEALRQVGKDLDNTNYYVNNLRNIWNSASIIEKQKAVRTLINKITITDGNVEIDYAI